MWGDDSELVHLLGLTWPLARSDDRGYGYSNLKPSGAI
jgi:hypothetical protein